MRSIGIRELRQQASRHLREVAERGETIEVTDRGRPVARIVPVPQTGAVDRLAAAGRLSETNGDVLDLGEPLTPRPGAEPASSTLARSRADER